VNFAQRHYAWFELRQFLVTRLSAAEFTECLRIIEAPLNVWLKGRYPNPIMAFDTKLRPSGADEVAALLYEARVLGRYTPEVNAEIEAWARKIRREPPEALIRWTEREVAAGRLRTSEELDHPDTRKRFEAEIGIKVSRQQIRAARAIVGKKNAPKNR
jgi:hypothetical protein